MRILEPRPRDTIYDPTAGSGQRQSAIYYSTTYYYEAIADSLRRVIMLAYGHFRLNDLARVRECLGRIDRPRSRAFYEWSLLNRLWLSHPEADKQPFIDLLREHLGVVHRAR